MEPCGENAECQTNNHLVSCTCSVGTEGDPYVSCNKVQEESEARFVVLVTSGFSDLTGGSLASTEIIDVNGGNVVRAGDYPYRFYGAVGEHF